jgi:hypothetical protein
MSGGAKLATVARRPAETPEALAEKRAEDLARVGRFLGRLQDKGYFGKVTISFQNGKLVELRTEQTLKVEEL